jgi:hypothetical protein
VTNRDEEIDELIRSIMLDGLLRMDAALEGDWSRTVSTVWTREGGSVPSFQRTTARRVAMDSRR